MDEPSGSERAKRRALRIGVAMATVVALATASLAVPFEGPRPAHADIPPGCILIGSTVTCNGVPVTQPPPQFPPPLQVGGVVERLVRGSAATAWLPLELEAKAATAELHQVPNDNRLLAGGRDILRSYMFLRLIDMIDRRKQGETLNAEEHAALSGFDAAVLAHKRLAAQKAIDQYDDWFTNRCNGYQPPAGFGFTAYSTGGGCTLLGQIFGGGPPPPTFDQFQAYGTALAYQSYTGSADAQSVIEDLNYGLAFAFGMVGAIGSALTAGAITASTPALANAIVRVAFPRLIPELTKAATRGFSQLVTIATRSVASVVAGAGGAAAATVVGVILAAAAITAIGGVVFSENATLRTKLVEARDQASVNLGNLVGTDEGEALLLAIFVNQTLPDLAAERAALVATPAAPSAGQPEWTITTPAFPDGTTQSVITTAGWDNRQQQTFVDGGYFFTSVAGEPWVRSLNLKYLGPRLSAAQFGHRRMVSIRGTKLYDHASELRTVNGFVILEDPVLVESFQFIPNVHNVPLQGDSPGPVHTARLTGNRPPVATGNATFYMLEDETSLTLPAPGVLGSVTDPDSDPLTATVTNQPSSGNVAVVSETGAFAYTLAAGTVLPIQFDVTASDGRGGSVLVPVTIAPNRRPVISTDPVIVPPGTVDFWCPASDPDGDALDLALTSTPQRGTATPQFGCFLYVSNSAVGPDSFSFTASDGKGGVTSGTMTLTVGIQPGVVFVDPPTSVREDTNVQFGLEISSGEGAPTLDPSCGAGSVVSITATTLTCRWADPSAAQTVSLEVLNPSGLEATASTVVTVTDATPPSWSTFPADIEVAADASTGSVVTYTPPTATDAVSPPVAVSCSHASGSTFPVGTTTVTCTATDTVGNPASRTFSVKVNPYVPPPAPLRSVADYAPVFSTSTFRTGPGRLLGATVRGPIAVWPNLPVVAPGQPAPVTVRYELTGPFGRGVRTTTTTTSMSPYDLAGRTITGYANLRTFGKGAWLVVVTVTRSDNSIISRQAVFTVR